MHRIFSACKPTFRWRKVLQKRVLKIIYNDFTSGNNAYSFNCIVAGLPQLADRRKQLTRHLFVKIADTDNCLNYLLPAKRDSEIISSFRFKIS